jgi:hypothetical protein
MSCRTPPPRSRDARGRLVTAHKGGLPQPKRTGRAPLSSELWHCTAYPEPIGGNGSHLGSSLNPRGAVLTGGVFRRSGSVACVRADASPSEVLAMKNATTRPTQSQKRGPPFVSPLPEWKAALTIGRDAHAMPARAPCVCRTPNDRGGEGEPEYVTVTPPGFTKYRTWRWTPPATSTSPTTARRATPAGC